MPLPRVLTFLDLQQLRQECDEAKKRLVFTNGCFDLLHIGHVRYLNEAKNLGDVLIVAINSDSSVKKLKGPSRPLQSESDRAEILVNLKAVDHAVIFEEQTPLKMIEAVRPDVLVKGGDWKTDQIVGAPFVESYGGKVYSLNFVDGKSTSEIIQRSRA